MLNGVFVDVAEDLVTAVLELPVDVLGEVGLVIPGGEVPSRRPRFGAHDHHHVGVACDDRISGLGDEFLRTLAADWFQHDAGGVAAKPAHHRARIVVRLAERCGHRTGDLELAQPEHRVDRLGDRPAWRRCRSAPPVPPPLRGRPPTCPGRRSRRSLSELADADEHRSTRVDRHDSPPVPCERPLCTAETGVSTCKHGRSRPATATGSAGSPEPGARSPTGSCPP